MLPAALGVYHTERNARAGFASIALERNSRYPDRNDRQKGKRKNKAGFCGLHSSCTERRKDGPDVTPGPGISLLRYPMDTELKLRFVCGDKSRAERTV